MLCIPTPYQTNPPRLKRYNPHTDLHLRDSKRRLATVLFRPDRETLVGLSSNRAGFGGMDVWQVTPAGDDLPRSAQSTR